MSIETLDTPENNEVAERMQALREHAGALAQAAEELSSVSEIMQAANLLMEKAPDALSGSGKALAMKEFVEENTTTRSETEVMTALNELRIAIEEKGEQPDMSLYEDSVPEYLLNPIRRIAYPG